jgi:hypothetical protein
MSIEKNLFAVLSQWASRQEETVEAARLAATFELLAESAKTPCSALSTEKLG